jgi:uncharacterized protein YecE (DUF72 family)
MKKSRAAAWHIGTSGWSYKHWKGVYYAEQLKPVEYLHFYSQEFDCTEINTSFYHLPKAQTVQKWVAEVPPGFIFCPKLSRYVTHFKKLHDPAEAMEVFFSVFDPVADRLGPILVQLPANVHFNAGVARDFYQLLSTTYKQYDFSIEVRDKTWFTRESLDLMEQYGVGLVIASSGKHFPYKEAVTARHIYLRFHGPEGLYSSSYAALTLRAYARKCAKWLHDKHQVWIFFNNDIYMHAIENARTLKTMLAEELEKLSGEKLEA